MWTLRIALVCSVAILAFAAVVQEKGPAADLSGMVDANQTVIAMLERFMKRGGKRDWEFCSSSSECNNGCCSSQYSGDGKTKCTPGGSNCVSGGGGGGGHGSKSDWSMCSSDSECQNGCCSKQYSNDGQFKCTPGASQCGGGGGGNNNGGGNNGGGSNGYTVPRNAWPTTFHMKGTPFAPYTGGEADKTWCGEHFDVRAGIVSLPLATWSKAYGSNSPVTYFSNPGLWQQMVNDICGLEVIVTGPGGTYKAVIGDTNMWWTNLDHNLHLAGKVSGMSYVPSSMSQVPGFSITGTFTGKKFSIKGGNYPYYY
ncbi:hypothetical protein PROFUN_07348 [Planoprotostelium fungivorum]|uniref:Uncharacterized protein n=1 Tax=Planoprotostelium fungivorum TaxID=1890364 RepID=A0A2P6NLZ6_9EUKA|nr:hypothetical protein PROFUN_07348 [Planoprotostelium fungivorum]